MIINEKSLDKMSTMGVYIIKHPNNGKFYIGSTSSSFRERYNSHNKHLRKGINQCRKLQNAYNASDNKEFEFSVLEVVENESQVLQREQYYLDLFNPAYNCRKTAENNKGLMHTEEAKNKMSQSKKLNYSLLSKEQKEKIFGHSKGTTLSDEHKLSISNSLKGYIKSPEHREALSKAMIGKTHTEETKRKISEVKKGKTLTEEHKQKISESNKGRVLSENNKQKLKEAKLKTWLVITPTNEEIIVEDLAAFCTEKDLSAKNMRQVAGGQKKTHKGYKCKKLE